jgi:hypothetical protein
MKPTDYPTYSDGIWESKTIPFQDVLKLPDDYSVNDLLEPFRDWMLGGSKMEWKYERNSDGDYIILRR